MLTVTTSNAIDVLAERKVKLF